MKREEVREGDWSSRREVNDNGMREEYCFVVLFCGVVVLFWCCFQ